ncbi:MAG TPA: hypothetical protein PLW31_12780 [Bacteroidales bacterium]|nr:hypothetical protein [Bacteroidales bacterium]HOX78898.1 hypothetical protein [Bacteroidales bacterium]HPI85035.1 hypothetical protein [Bacteroidales bacterium]HPM91961.1 hypothetical protein [Bacteroidales bacterium]
MKRASAFLIVLLSGLFIVSCQKPADVTSNPAASGIEKTGNPFVTPEARQALVNTLREVAQEQEAIRGAHFLPAFYTDWGFGFLDDDMVRLASFSTVIDENDFFRENPDGTVTVHIQSETAFSELFNYSTYDYYFGSNGHMVMNYTGPVMMIPIFDNNGNFLGFIYLVQPDNSSPASVWHGNGPVQLWGMGQEYNLVAKLIANAGWKKVNKSIKLN